MNFKDDIERQVWETTIADSWGFVNPDDCPRDILEASRETIAGVYILISIRWDILKMEIKQEIKDIFKKDKS